ncbi:unnamed protein product, partial [marine sediment metagenome]
MNDFIFAIITVLLIVIIIYLFTRKSGGDVKILQDEL